MSETEQIITNETQVPVVFFSASTMGFYRLDIHTPDMIPADAVEITFASYTGLLAGMGAGGGKVLAVLEGWPVLVSAPVPEPEPTVTFKSDIWKRCSDPQADALDAALLAAPTKLRRAWSDSLQIVSSDPAFAMLLAQMSAHPLFGPEETARILAAS